MAALAAFFAGFSWPEFGVLLAAAIIGVVCVMPYTLALMSDTIANARERVRLPFWALLLFQGAQGTVLIGLAAGSGLLFARQVGLGAPLLAGVLAGRDVTAPAAGDARASDHPGGHVGGADDGPGGGGLLAAPAAQDARRVPDSRALETPAGQLLWRH
jgi:hypothetical protein